MEGGVVDGSLSSTAGGGGGGGIQLRTRQAG